MFPLIEAENLQHALASAQPPVVVDCRFDLMAPAAGHAAYLQSHVPNAHYLNLDTDLSDKTQTLAGRHPLPTPQAFEALLRSLGVHAHTQLVAYDTGDLAMAARFWWLCQYHGHLNVQVLNGGFAAWQALGLPVTQQVPAQPAQGTVCLQANPAMRALYHEVEARGFAGPLIDSRDAARYKGELEPIDPVAGHIPGAVNCFWKGVLGADGKMKSEAELRTHWAWLQEEPDPPVVYCGSGVTACVNILSLACLGVPHVRLFAGSWSEWCARGGQVATGEG